LNKLVMNMNSMIVKSMPKQRKFYLIIFVVVSRLKLSNVDQV